MFIPPKAPQSVTQHISKIEQALDDVVNYGDDDMLFISSYLQGHFAVVARNVEMQESASLVTLDSEIRASLHAAFENNELDTDDQDKVLSMWERLFTCP